MEEQASKPNIISNSMHLNAGAAPAPIPETTGGTSDNTKTIVTVLVLLFFYPVGLILMWLWTKWKTWVKVVISLLGCGGFILGLLAIFATSVLIAINPAAQFSKARDTARISDVQSISNAVAMYLTENRGQLPPGLTKICPETHKIGLMDLDLSSSLVPKYFNQMPADPLLIPDETKSTILPDIGYEVCIADPAAKTITVSAPKAEGGTPIFITR